jgi:hypothetical protein
MVDTREMLSFLGATDPGQRVCKVNLNLTRGSSCSSHSPAHSQAATARAFLMPESGAPSTVPECLQLSSQPIILPWGPVPRSQLSRLSVIPQQLLTSDLSGE